MPLQSIERVDRFIDVVCHSCFALHCDGCGDVARLLDKGLAATGMPALEMSCACTSTRTPVIGFHDQRRLAPLGLVAFRAERAQLSTLRKTA